MPDKWQWLCPRGPSITWGGGWGVQDLREVSPQNNQAEDFSMGSCGQPEFSSWNSSGTQCPQTLELSASSVNHSLPLALFLATHGQYLVWGGRFLSSKSWSGCSCCNEKHADLVPEQPDGTWRGFLSPYVPLSTLIAIGSVLFSVLLWPSAHSCQGNNCQGKCGAGGKLCCSQLTRITASKCIVEATVRVSKCGSPWGRRPCGFLSQLLICRKATHLVLLPDQILKPKTIPSGVLPPDLASEVPLRFPLGFPSSDDWALWCSHRVLIIHQKGRWRQEINILLSVQKHSCHYFHFNRRLSSTQFFLFRWKVWHAASRGRTQISDFQLMHFSTSSCCLLEMVFLYLKENSCHLDYGITDDLQCSFFVNVFYLIFHNDYTLNKNIPNVKNFKRPNSPFRKQN